MTANARIEVVGPKKMGSGTLEYYEETDALYAFDTKQVQRRVQDVREVELSLNELGRTLVWGEVEYEVADLEAAREFVAAVNHGRDLAAQRRAEQPPVTTPSHPTPAAARLRAFKSGGLLETLGFLYGLAAVIGAFVLAMQEDSFGDRPYVGVGVAAGFVGVILATFLVAFGRLVSAWALTHGIDEELQIKR